jgi:hypothetical protein
VRSRTALQSVLKALTMTQHAAPQAPIDPARHRALVASIYASLSHPGQYEALDLIAQWPRMIHNLARAGELSAPGLAPS